MPEEYKPAFIDDPEIDPLIYNPEKECFSLFRKICFENTGNYLIGTELGKSVCYSIGGKNYICLYCEPDKYDPITEGETNKFGITGAGSYVKFSMVRKGLTAQFDYPQTDLINSIEKIARNIEPQKTFINVLDYVRPEPKDYVKGFTKRRGMIYMPLRYKGQISGWKTIKVQSKQLVVPTTKPLFTVDGFSLTFMENHYRES